MACGNVCARGAEHASCLSPRRGTKRSIPFSMTQIFERLREEGGARFGDRAAAPKRREVAEEKGSGDRLAFSSRTDQTRSLVPGSGLSEG